MSTIRLETTDQRARRLADEADDDRNYRNYRKPKRAAKMSVAAVWADCAKCGGHLADAAGLQLLTLDEFPDDGLACNHCGQVNSLPKKFANP